MSPAARSILVFGIYVLAIGVAFFIAPNLILPILGLPLTTDFWVRITGIVACVIGYYYLVSARAELTTFFRASTYARTGVCVAVLALVLTNSAPLALLPFGILDLMGAAWTHFALRRTAKPSVSAA